MSDKIIVTVSGVDNIGIVAKVTATMAQYSVNIEDISQTIVQDNFTMIMMCELSNSTLSINDLSIKLDQIQKEIGVSIHVQHEDIFKAMHTI